MKPTTEYPPHELSLLFDMEPQESLEKLADSIKLNGQREKIVLLDGKVLDGNNRQKACAIAKVAPQYREFGSDPGDGPSPAHFVRDRNLLRRHLTVGQKATIADEFFPIFQAESNMPAADARKVVAATFGTTTGSMRKAGEIKAADPAIAAEVKSGKTTLNAAKKKVEAKKNAAPAGPSAEEVQAPADAGQIKALRKANAAAIEKQHGEAFGAAFSKGVVLKTLKELDEFLALDKDDRKLIQELVIRGWAVKPALKMVHRILDDKSTLGDLILQAASFETSKSKMPKLVVNGWVITARKVVEGAD